MNNCTCESGIRAVMPNSMTCEMLSHPELLSDEQLLSIIVQRHLKIPSLEMMSREALLDIFHNYCVPYTQRRKATFRNKTKAKIVNNTLVKFDILYGHDGDLKMCEDNLDKSGDVLTGHMRRIKFSSETDNKMSCDIVALKRRSTDVNFMDRTALESPPVKRERKLITWP